MMRFRLLGPLEVWDGDRWLGIGAPKWRSVLAALLIHAGQVVSVDTLADELWGANAPAKAANLVSIYVLRLRRLTGAAGSELLVTRSPGYLLRSGEPVTDAQRFEELLGEGRTALARGQQHRAAETFAEALALWRGAAYADVPRTELVAQEADRLEQLKLDAAELRAEAELGCGNHAQMITELRRLLASSPLRERLWLLLIDALDGAGRRAEALDAYGQARSAIGSELGVEPGPELRSRYAKLLADDFSAELQGPAAAELGGSISSGTAPASGAARDAGGIAGTGIAGTGGTGTGGAGTGMAGTGMAGTGKTRPATQRPAQLPADIADFTGRDEQVERLRDLLAGPASDTGAVRVAVLAGYGGLGKTSLAIHAAHQVRDRFADGQLYVDLLGATDSPASASGVLARFLRDLGVPGEDIPVGQAELAARYRTALNGRQVLVVLDNARDAAQVRPLLPGSASCAVLITTRSRMPDLASTNLVDLNVLDDDEALALFTKVVGVRRAAAEPDATAEVLEACAGLPLAIRICAARLAGRRRWAIRTMADRLRDEHRRLDELTAGDLAVRASFEVSFASLPRPRYGIDPARAFRLLGLWQGPAISAEAAAALCGASLDDATDALELLVDANLLECLAAGRYKFHDLLRVYAAERAEEDLPGVLREAAVHRLLWWYLRTADTASTAVVPHRYDIPLGPAADGAPEPLGFTDAQAALAWYDDDRASILAAICQAAASGRHGIAWRMTAPLFVVFNRRAHWAEAAAIIQIALESARDDRDRRGEGWLLNNLGRTLSQAGYAKGIGYLEQSMRIRHEIADRRGEAQSANNLADMYAKFGRPSDALGPLHRALELNQEIGYAYGVGVALVNLGDALLATGRAEEGLGWLVRARDVFTDLQDTDGLGYAEHCAGRCYLELGRAADALRSLGIALSCHRESGNSQREAVTLCSLARAQRHDGQERLAEASFIRAAEIYDELGDQDQAAGVRAECSGHSG